MKIKVKLFYFLLKDLGDANFHEGIRRKGWMSTEKAPFRVVQERTGAFICQLPVSSCPHFKSLHICIVHVKRVRECKVKVLIATENNPTPYMSIPTEFQTYVFLDFRVLICSFKKMGTWRRQTNPEIKPMLSTMNLSSHREEIWEQKTAGPCGGAQVRPGRHLSKGRTPNMLASPFSTLADFSTVLSQKPLVLFSLGPWLLFWELNRCH